MNQFYSCLLLFFALISSFESQAQRKEYVIFEGKVTGSLDGAKLVVNCSGRNEFSKFDLATGSFQIRLGFNKDCEAIFSKPGFVSQRIQFNTAVPKERLEEGFPEYEVNIDFKPQINSVPYEFKHEVSYDDYLNNFDFKLDMVRSVNKQM